MDEQSRKQRNDSRLQELYPTFRQRIEAVILELESNGFRPRIQEAWRSIADQKKKVTNGHSKVEFGFHNVTAPDGTKEALAVDLIDDDAPLKPSKNYILHLAAAAEAQGLETGIRWGTFSEDEIAAIDSAIATQDWNADIKIGWDPMHVQPTDVTIDQAKDGARPV